MYVYLLSLSVSLSLLISGVDRYSVASAPKDVYERLQRIEDRVIELEKVAAVAELLRIHKGKGVDALLAELNSTTPTAPVAPLSVVPTAAAPGPATPALAPSHAAPPPAEEPQPVRPARAVPEDPKEMEERIAQLKESLRRKQEEKRQKTRAGGAGTATLRIAQASKEG